MAEAVAKKLAGQEDTQLLLSWNDWHDTQLELRGPLQPWLEHCEEHSEHVLEGSCTNSVEASQDDTQSMPRTKFLHMDPLTTAA